ncbi:hypothetical protein [Actinoplanes siamensis]|uniref:Uncharacterized protein n=1 Tax=Actinoplanes siamensis TaxID=1223317 RepID=A0A919KC10_9ACTN|nr:hypothetical protein [Actinoplanes siamensis]GIF02808.1 hypothetical protein Asi03nite_03460 [Actinoplanes siamensis]
MADRFGRGRAVIAVVRATSAPGRWQLVSSTATGADVLAQVGNRPASRRHQPWRRPLEQIRDGAGELNVVATGDGHFRWTLTAEDGSAIAESPAVHRDADTCRLAFFDAQRAAGTALGGPRRVALDAVAGR